MRRLLPLVAFGLSVFTFMPTASSYPELVRHGYVNCTACHVSPSGGGVLSPYGRELSRELLSTWGTEKESKFNYGWFSAKEPPESLRTGGDVRAVQTLRDNSKTKVAMTIPMQADFEAGVDDKGYAAIVSLGLRGAVPTSRDLNQFFSRRHYFLIRPTEESSVRVGKFLKSFGLNIADHFVSVRRGLRWDYGTESYNVEYAHLGEKFSYYATAMSDDPEEPGIARESGLALNAAWALWDSSRLGVSYFYGKSNGTSRDVFGPYWILSLSPHFFWMSEVDWQLRNPDGGKRTSGYASFSRLGYEVFKGMVGYIQYERTHLDPETTTDLRHSFGLGAQWFPRPHWEFIATLSREMTPDSEDVQFAWLLVHFYL